MKAQKAHKGVPFMPMHTIIQHQRKALGLTQEQVARCLNVSTAAVSKWENGLTSPDVGLLPPLARLLNVDMNTLFGFHETLSRQEISLFCNQLAGMAPKEAFSLAREKLREFPRDEPLRLSLALLLDGLLMQAQEDIPELEAELSTWYTQLGQSTDECIQVSAKSMQVNRCIRQNQLDEAQEVLDTIPDKRALSVALPDKLLLQVSIYLKRGQPEQAALALEQALFQEGTRVQLLLSNLVDAELSCGAPSTAHIVAEKSQVLAQALDLWPYNQHIALWQVAVHNRNTEEALAHLEHMLEAMEQPWQLGDTVLYRRMTHQAKDFQPQALRAMVVEQLEGDPDLAWLRNHPQTKALLGRFCT